MAKNPDRYHARLDHCTEILRQKLMCDADAGIVTYNWVKGKDSPVANYNVMHQCRKYDVLMEWSERRAATGAVFRKTGSAIELDQDP
ncbi:b3ea2ab6-fd5a-4167-aa01-3fb3ef4322d7 [Sclerotinia trifoliorum]|uniref:B3ea2ab6-fd5a-4167-aa01-3fb3ef4322d7 n=1 Tax=Sclerotinia trifoliorum TaxID=28548 RepID=A0A8H2VTS5_9HELO|nr:b3ea2ab6-fd5a-4167-aa01-3fb3ef4322d7 [Sclerotinia trifoliorum]